MYMEMMETNLSNVHEGLFFTNMIQLAYSAKYMRECCILQTHFLRFF